jgi:AbrB family looped-hinge helix DNA binding protein
MVLHSASKVRISAMSNALTQKSQVTVPKSVRQQLGIGPGDRVTFAANDRGEMVMKAELKAQKDCALSLEEIQANLDPQFLAELARFDNDAVAYIRWLRGE